MTEKGSSFDALVAELKSLRKGVGLTREKVEKSPILLDALKVRQPARPYEWLLEQLDQLESAEAAALRNAYAIGVKPPGSLTRRRNDFGESVDRHEDTIEDWENAAIRSLASSIQLVDADLAGYVHVWVRVENRLIRSLRIFEVPRSAVTEETIAAAAGGSETALVTTYSDNRAEKIRVVAAYDYISEEPTPQFAMFRTPADNALDIVQFSVWFRFGERPSSVWVTFGHNIDDFYGCRWGRWPLKWADEDDRRATIAFEEPPTNTTAVVCWAF